MQSEPILEVSDLACERGEHRLFEGLSFAISSGELMRVQGENGKGKTTLLRTLCGFVQPAQGSVRWQGRDIHEWDDQFHSQKIGRAHV